LPSIGMRFSSTADPALVSYAGAGAVFLAFALGMAAVSLFARIAARLPQDAPNERSLHIRPVPRAGGLAIWVGFLPAALWFPPDFPGGVSGWLPPWLLLLAVSAIDDARGVAVVVRLAAHAASALWCAAWLIAGGPAGANAYIAVIALALLIAWACNLYNFMDGNDGLAATMTLVGFGAYGVAAMRSGDHAVPYLALAAATLPFLVVNRPRATMFLGDSGSVPLGFVAAAFGAAGTVTGQWPAWFPVLVFLPFIADATVTLFRRAVRGERVVLPHRDHYYQRLHRLGAGHAGTLSVYAVLMIATAGTALGCLVFAPAWGPVALVLACVVCFILFAAIDYHWRRKPTAPR
jgi:UDP-GlcNAc:undecaprenyl-phosphate/decaprenyl-phosphate GlcNAc-1-phosphate transferase